MKQQTDPVVAHYDSLIDEDNDPARDPKEAREYMDRWDGQAFLDALRLTPEKSVLEIGVGTGRLALRVYGLCGSFTGIDLSPKTIERARVNLRNSSRDSGGFSENPRGCSNAALFCGDFLTHPFYKTFDVVYSSLTWMHLKDKRRAARRAADLLADGGRFVLSLSKSQQTEIDFGTRRLPVFPDTPEETRALLIRAGLTAQEWIETEYAHIVAAEKKGAGE